MSDSTDSKTDNLIEKCFLDINEDVKLLSDNKDKSLISSKDFTKSFENFVIKTIVNKKIVNDVPNRSIKKDSYDEKSYYKKKFQKYNKNVHSSEEIVPFNRNLERKRFRPLKSVVASSKLSNHADSLDLVKISNNHKSRREDLKCDARNFIEDRYKTKYDDHKSYRLKDYSEYDKKDYESQFNYGRKRTIGSLMDKYEDLKHQEFEDKYKSNYKPKNKSNKQCHYIVSESKSLSPTDKSKDVCTSEVLEKLKSRFEDQPFENDNYSENEFYVPKKTKIPLYSEHDDRFYKDDSVASFKKPIESHRKDGGHFFSKPNAHYQNFTKYYYYDSNPDIYSLYYNSAAYYQPRYHLPHPSYVETYQIKTPRINNANAIYGGIADFQDAFNVKADSKVKSEPGEHITYNKDYTSISLKYDETFDSKDDTASDSENEKKMHSKKKKANKSKRSKKEKSTDCDSALIPLLGVHG